jgi:dihydropteroate synthase
MAFPQAPRAAGGSARPDVGASFAAILDRWRSAGPSRVPIIMGIVNVTPDSFYDGGRFADAAAAISHAEKLAEAGAAILDIGGESTRKGAIEVPAREEIERVLPVIESLAATGATISIDTMKAEVAEAAIEAGATVVNDIRGLQGDPQVAVVAARHGAGVIAMHNPGVHGSAKPLAGDPVDAVHSSLERSLALARRAGIREDRIVLDPGFGFGKSPEQNLEILKRLRELTALGTPILVGTSRKSFIGRATGRDNPDRLAGTLATSVVAALAGAAILRVHDVAEHVEAMRMVGAILAAGNAP